MCGQCRLLQILRRMLELSAEDLTNRAIHRRAVEAVNLGMPVVRYNRMYDAMVSAGGAFHQIAYVPRLHTWKNQALTILQNGSDALTEVCSSKGKLTSADRRGTMKIPSAWRICNAAVARRDAGLRLQSDGR